MNIHHTKHHQTYVTNLNASLEKLDAALSSSATSDIIGLQSAIKFNGGGHLNHALFWKNLCPEGQSELKSDGVLAAKINESFGGVEEMKQEMSAKSVAVQGSGWGWLSYNKQTGT